MKQLREAPPVPVKITEGLTWSVEFVDHPTQKNDDGTPKRVPAGVVRKRFRRGEELVKYGVQVFTKTKDKPLGTQIVKLQTIDGQAYQVTTSDSFTSVEDIDRIEVTRQRFLQTIIKDVHVRPDLMPIF